MNSAEAVIALFVVVMCFSMALTAGITAELKTQFRLLCELAVYISSIGVVNLVFFKGALNELGIRPRTSIGLFGILFAPFLHWDWQHLIGNTIFFLIFGWLVMLGGIREFLIVTVVTLLVAGIGVWLFGRPRVHAGASGLLFGYLGFLVLRGYFEGDPLSGLLSALVGGIYGRLLWGIFPGQKGISWESHLFGLLGGVLAARYLVVLNTMLSPVL